MALSKIENCSAVEESRFNARKDSTSEINGALGRLQDRPTIISASTPNVADADVRSILQLTLGPVELTSGEEPAVSKASAVLIIITLTGISFVGSMSIGLVTIALPKIADDLSLAPSLLLWPASVYSLTSSSCLILAGAVADFVGNRTLNLSGCLLLATFTLATGLSRTGIQIILFRACQGIAVSMCLPTAFSILTDTFHSGRRQNIGISMLGLAQPFGFSVGLVMGGVLEGTSIGWRFGFYASSFIMLLLFAISWWKLPRDKPREAFSWREFLTEIDWVGVVIASTCLGISSYVFAIITGNLRDIRKPSTVALVCVAGVMVPSFVLWMKQREKLGKPALIPNSLWKNTPFTTICIMVLLSWAVLNSMELFLSLLSFQNVQLLTPLQSAIRFLPNVIIGMILNLGTGLLVHRIRADYLVLVTSFLSAISPLLMAVIHPDWSWWTCAFWGVLLGPLSADVIFTVANLIITDAFSPSTQALAGAVFNTVAQYGTSVGIMATAIISSSVTAHSGYASKNSPEALMRGYRVVFWACFGLMLSACCVGMLGLRKVGKIGLKRE